MSEDKLIQAPVSITEQLETFIREDGSTYTRHDIFVKLFVTFRDAMLAQLKGPRLSVYLCIALHCGPEMTAWPSLNTISRETGYSKRAVITAISNLEAMNLIELCYRKTDRGDPDSNLYTIRGYISMGSKPTSFTRGSKPTSFTRGSESSSLGVVNLVHPKKNQYKKIDDDGRLPTACRDAYHSLVFLGVDPDVARTEAANRDPDFIIAWCAALQHGNLEGTARNLPGLILSKLRADSPVWPEVNPGSIARLIKDVHRWRADFKV